MDSRRGCRFPRNPPLHGLPLGHMSRHTNSSDYSNCVTNYEREPRDIFRNYDSWHWPSDTGSHLDPFFTHNEHPPSQRFDRYHESMERHNFQNPSLRSNAVNTAPAPGICSLAGNRSGQFLDQGIRNLRQIPPVSQYIPVVLTRQGQPKSPIRGKEMEGKPRQLSRIIPGSSKMVHSKFCGSSISSQKPSHSLHLDQKQKNHQLFKHSVETSASDALHDKPLVREKATTQSVGNTGAEHSSQNLLKGSPLLNNQSSTKGKFVPVSSDWNHRSNPEPLLSLQTEKKSLDKVNFPKESTSKLSATVTEVGNIMNKDISLGQAGGERVSKTPQENSRTEKLDEVELTSKFKDIDLCASNRETNELYAFPENDLSDFRKDKDLMENISQLDESDSSERKVVEITSAVTKGVDVASAVTKVVVVTSEAIKSVDVISALAKEVDVTCALTKDVDVSSAVAEKVDLTQAVTKGVDVTSAMATGVDLSSAVAKEVDATCPVTKGVYVTSTVTKGVNVTSVMMKGVDVTNAASDCDKSNDDFYVKDAKKFVEMEIDNYIVFSTEIVDESNIERNELKCESNFVEIDKCPSSLSTTNESVSKLSKQDEGYNIAQESFSKAVVKSESILHRSKEDTGIKSKGNYVVSRENESNASGQKNLLEVENESKQVALNSITALQRRVLEKVNKPSFVKQVSDYSLALLAKQKVEVPVSYYGQNVADESLKRTGSHESMPNDFTMETDTSLDNFSSLPGNSDSNLTNNLPVSVENQKLKDSANEELDYTEERNEYENNVCYDLGSISEGINGIENGNVDMNVSSGSNAMEAEGTDDDFGEYLEGDVSIELNSSVDTFISSSVDNNDLEEEDPSLSCGTIANVAVETNEGLQETDFAQLKKDFNIKEAFVSLKKIDVKRREEKSHQMIYKTDKQNKPVGEIQVGNETEGSSDKLESHINEPDQTVDNDDKLVSNIVKPDQTEVNTDKLSVLEPDQAEVNTDKLSVLEPDQAEVNTDKLGSSIVKLGQINTDALESAIVEPDQAKENTDDLESSIVKPDQAEENKQPLTDGIRYRNVISLNERFSQLPNKNIDGGTEDDSEEKAYKAEFENILNKLSKKSLLGSQSEIEKGKVMEVELEREDDKKETIDGDNIQTKSEAGGAKCLQDGSRNEATEMKEPTQNAKDKELDESSPVSFLAFSDEESDDELLRTPSAFLRSIEEINGRPVVITPTKIMDSSQNSTATTSSSDLSPVKPIAQRPGVKNKFTLDGLLADHEEKADLVREMDEINQQLQDEIKQGGFVNILNKEDAATESQITEEQKEMLKHFEVQESRICEDRPGVVVFQPQHYKCLFSSMLHPTHCGFTVGSNGLLLEKHIESLRTGQYKRVITSDIIYQCFTKISCQSPLLRWLFFIMSIHDDHQVQQGCKKILLEVLHFQHVYSHQKWTPRLTDVLSVLVNYGASLETLLPADCGSNTLECVRGKLMQEPGYVHGPGQQNAEVSVENLILVLKILTQCLYGPSGRYKPDDLSLLCVALCKASLDSSLTNMCAKGAFQNCITMLIRHYSEVDWLKERLKLTRMLVGITHHHHNCAHIAELLPPGQRGLFLQRRFCYLVLSEILLDKTNVSNETLNTIQIKDLQLFVPKLEELLENDTYKMSSVVTLIDLCVGVHITMNSEQREQLKSLLEQVRRVRVRDNVSMLDRTWVKDMIVRMTSKWALDIQTMKGKQTKIFEYASPMKICIEQVKTLQSSDEENSDIDDNPPSKIQKLSKDADF